MTVCATMHRINLPRAVATTAALEVALAVAAEAGIAYPKHDKLRVCSNVNTQRGREGERVAVAVAVRSWGLQLGWGHLRGADK